MWLLWPGGHLNGSGGPFGWVGRLYRSRGSYVERSPDLGLSSSGKRPVEPSVLVGGPASTVPRTVRAFSGRSGSLRVEDIEMPGDARRCYVHDCRAVD